MPRARDAQGQVEACPLTCCRCVPTGEACGGRPDMHPTICLAWRVSVSCQAVTTSLLYAAGQPAHQGSPPPPPPPTHPQRGEKGVLAMLHTARTGMGVMGDIAMLYNIVKSREGVEGFLSCHAAYHTVAKSRLEGDTQGILGRRLQLDA